MRGEIICIGDELMSGRVAETNSRYIARRLWPLGIELRAVVQVGDEPAAIREALTRALASSDFVVVTGGLGPTEDDITARMAAEVFELPLAESQRMMANLRACAQEQGGGELSQQVRRLAWLPEGAEILCPTCAGFRLTAPGEVPVYFLPGVPPEMRRITEDKLLPELAARLGRAGWAVAGREVRLCGLAESEVASRLEGLAGESLRLGYYPVFPEVEVTITARAPSREEADREADRVLAEVVSRLADNVVSTGGESQEEVAGRLLTELGLTISLAESCTGGLIGHRLTGVSGSSAYFERGLVVYSNRAKEELLGVSPDTLAEFGAVSPQTAREMALGARRAGGSDVGLAVTGIAGPTGGSEDKPVGTVHFGLARGQEAETLHRRFHGGREAVKAQAAETALDLLRRRLERDASVRGA
jgi:nicotinamide-nucleotide amidase